MCVKCARCDDVNATQKYQAQYELFSTAAAAAIILYENGLFITS